MAPDRLPSLRINSTGLLGAGWGGDSTPGMIAFQADPAGSFAPGEWKSRASGKQ